MKKIRIATRASQLALAQTHIVREALLRVDPHLDISVIEITTQGDVDRSDFIYQSQSQGLFTSAVQHALLDGRADLAVHSLKDLPTNSPDELILAAIPKRESAADVLIAKYPISKGLEDLPE